MRRCGPRLGQMSYGRQWLKTAEPLSTHGTLNCPDVTHGYHLRGRGPAQMFAASHAMTVLRAH
ncbi:hypothetical protein GCM10018793_15330 [Streptomyces sulfonofaciens]|uniref:Uncharacterized protein n=1 Tax=Streptomyces sulfonofaciens TaxID=68272 RepID=A0A919KW00_9ACTN|nr:hypothetical protein GCM10018793_15330 [Streptomyces sulfonofaciens]